MARVGICANGIMRAMRIRMVCPAPPRTLYGNRITALRWARILRKLGHSVSIDTAYEGAPCDVLIALHAKRSAGAVFDFHERHSGKPVIVALTGTDLYRDLKRSREARTALELATRIVALQPLASEELTAAVRPKLRVIYQSVEKTGNAALRSKAAFQVCVAGHLRDVKDPFRAATAVRRLPAESKIRIVHAGAAMDEQMAARARAEEARNARYRWVGEISRSKVRRLIASSHILVLSSRMEGGANVISEAAVDGTPVIASRIPGSIGLLGEDYPGFYPFGQTDALRELLLRAESDAPFYSGLRRRVALIAPLFRPQREVAAWGKLLAEVAPR
jgi:putative glycosyltransferase (TIGR04348 family)